MLGNLEGNRMLGKRIEEGGKGVTLLQPSTRRDDTVCIQEVRGVAIAGDGPGEQLGKPACKLLQDNPSMDRVEGIDDVAVVSMFVWDLWYTFFCKALDNIF